MTTSPHAARRTHEPQPGCATERQYPRKSNHAQTGSCAGTARRRSPGRSPNRPDPRGQASFIVNHQCRAPGQLQNPRSALAADRGASRGPSQADRFTASSAPHIHTVLAARLAEGRCRSAAPCLASRILSSISVRIRCQASTATALAGVDTSRLVAMNEYAYTCPTSPSNARAELVLGDGAPAAGPRIAGDVPGADLDPPHHTRGAGRPAGRGVVTHGDLGA